MDEDLVGYLLKSLEPDEQQATEAHLDANPEARAKVEQLERALSPLSADADEPELPPGLALATLAKIAEHKCRPTTPPPAPRPQLAASAWPRLRFADALAAAALLLIAGGLTIPLLAKLRQDRDRVACADNLRVLWGALSNYSEQVPDRSFPMIEEQGPRSVAAAFVPILHDAGMLPKTTLVACPARREQRKPANISLVGLSEAFGKGDEEFGTLARDLAGGYAYSLGYRNGDELVGLRASDPDTLPIIADLSEGSENSLNHGGSGQNVLYIGGNVRWCVKPTVGEEGDDIYVNRQFVLRAGESRSDTVLGPGDARPDGPSK